MEFKETPLEGIKIIKPSVFEDQRGFFFESYNRKDYKKILGKNISFVQDNQSKSKKNVLRGLHFQIKKPQGKLIRVLKGKILDVVVDLRKDSKSFSNSYSIFLTEESKEQLWVPPGFAHGFLVMSEYAEVSYKTTDYWYPEYEKTLVWNDPNVSVDWPINNPLLSEKDSNGLSLSELESIL
tara:strand:+ start:30343 stop:30885 length:543 start_codon:yes stop_codon:yes gene_type:complete